MMVAKAAETRRRILICDKTYFMDVHLLVLYVSVSEIQFFLGDSFSQECDALSMGHFS